MSEARASVIIPIWNGSEYLPACLDALLAQDYPDLEVVAVDNASTDNSADLVAEGYPQVHLIRNAHNLGFAGGCNAGLRTAQGDVLALLNQDTRVRPGWLQALVEALENPRIGVVGSKILYPDGRTIQHAGGWIEWPLGLAHHYGQGEADAGQWDEPGPVEYVTGAALALRRGVLDQIGLLDEGFWPGYFEDADFCFRIRGAGYEVRYISDAVLTHVETTSLTDLTILSRSYQRGRLRFVLKHMPPGRFLAEFVPAEKVYQSPMRGGESGSLRSVYLETLPVAASLLRRCWQADAGIINEVLAALQRLHRQAWEEDWNRVREWAATLLPPQSPAVTEDVPLIPPLEEFEFHSTVPVVGSLIARLRSLWYGVAARWAVRHLTQQQEAINRQLGLYLDHLEQWLMALAEENAFLAQQIARLVVQTNQREE